MRTAPEEFKTSCSGFSLVELCIVIAVIFIIGSFAVLNIDPIRVESRANKAMYQVVDILRKGRATAVTQRRVVELRFQGDDEVRLVRRDIPEGETVIRTLELSHGYRFMQFDGIPDSPDNFGNASPLSFGGENPLTFVSEGMLTDSQGDPLNGSIFIGLEGNPETARVVTILGATGRVQGYEWSGDSWVQ